MNFAGSSAAADFFKARTKTYTTYTTYVTYSLLILVE